MLWGGVPAILKGWFDRVLAHGFAYADGRRYEHGYFKSKRGILGITTGGTLQRSPAGGSYGEMNSVLHGVQHRMLEYLGLDTVPPFVAYAAPRVDDVERETYLKEWRRKLMNATLDEEWLRNLRRGSLSVEPISAGELSGGWGRKN